MTTTIAKFVSDELTNDLKWREAELAIMRQQLIATSIGGIEETVMLRSNITMIYAHYEGFCKFSLESYLDGLRKLTVKRKDLNWPLATHSLSRFHRKLLLIKSDSKEFFETTFTEMNDILNENADYDNPPQIANLWPNLLISWLGKLGLDSTIASSQQVRLNSLVNNRNQIAHGKKLVISRRDELDKYALAAMMAMHEVAIGIVDALDNKTYRRATARTTTFNQSI